MKKITMFIALLLLFSTVWAQNSSSATYTGGNVTCYYQMNNPTPPATSNTNIPLTVNVPLGARITSVDVEYDIRSTGDYRPNNIRSYLKCTSIEVLNGTYETSCASVGYQDAPVTVHYSRTGLDLANTFEGGGDIDFQLNCFDLSCNDYYQGSSYVVNNTFKVTVHYSDEFDFLLFNAQANGIGQVLLEWENFNDPGYVLVASNTSDNFIDPVNGVNYAPGVMLGESEILYFGNEEEFNHNDLEDMTTYYYKAWACDDPYLYSVGLSAEVTTSGDTVYPIEASFDSDFPIGWSTEVSVGNGSWAIESSPTAQSGAGNAKLTRVSYENSLKSTLISSPFYFPGINYSLSFWVYRNTTASQYDKLCAYLSNTTSVDDGVMLTEIYIRSTLSPAVSTTGWYQYSFDLSDYGLIPGDIKHLIFEGTLLDRRPGAAHLKIDQMVLTDEADFPENENTSIDGIVIQPNVNLFYNSNIDANNPLITSLPNYDYLGDKRVIGLTGYAADIDILATAPSGSWYGRIYYGGSWHTADPAFIAETDVEREFTFVSVNFTAKDGDVFIFLNNGEDFTLPVELSSFSATTTSENFAQISWATASESNLLGYNVYRNERDNSETCQRVNSTIISANNYSTGSNYSFVDSEIEIETTYYYWLESLELSNEGNLYGPVNVRVESEENNNILPTTTNLFSAYPNPFNPETTINFNVKENDMASLVIFNLKGQVVKSYADFLPGQHSIVWKAKDKNSNDVASGVYFYKLTSDSYKKTKRMILMK